jgi:hypothetical protein
MNNVEIKNYRLKRKKVDIPRSKTLLDFNDEISNLKECPLKFVRVEAEEHHFYNSSCENYS